VRWVAITIEPALTPNIRSNLSGPSNNIASMTPAVKAHLRLPPSRMRVSYVCKEFIGLFL
jgi:hypothetical protein